jgi:uncharacterized membrane protein
MKFRLAVTAVVTLLVAAGALAATEAESEIATNRRGYALLRQGDVQGAIAVFRENVQAHPESWNVYDSLAEAYEAAGETEQAVANYREALARNPRAKNARYALERLTGEKRPLRPLVVFHVAAGILGLIAGTTAMALRKGSRRHALAGRVFVMAMLFMGSSGAYIAYTDPLGEAINVLAGIMACYLVVTAWLTARRGSWVGRAEWLAAVVGVAVAFSLVRYGLEAESESGGPSSDPGAVFFVFAAVAFIAVAGDIRLIERGGVTGTRRIVRHLWRMCVALFIAVGSFFLGQPQVFPDWLRQSPGLRALPVLLVLAAMVFWLVRVRRGSFRVAAASG